MELDVLSRTSLKAVEMIQKLVGELEKQVCLWGLLSGLIPADGSLDLTESGAEECQLFVRRPPVGLDP